MKAKITAAYVTEIFHRYKKLPKLENFLQEFFGEEKEKPSFEHIMSVLNSMPEYKEAEK